MSHSEGTDAAAACEVIEELAAEEPAEDLDREEVLAAGIAEVLTRRYVDG